VVVFIGYVSWGSSKTKIWAHKLIFIDGTSLSAGQSRQSSWSWVPCSSTTLLYNLAWFYSFFVYIWISCFFSTHILKAQLVSLTASPKHHWLFFIPCGKHELGIILLSPLTWKTWRMEFIWSKYTQSINFRLETCNPNEKTWENNCESIEILHSFWEKW
jgi:hypothetical protein